MTLTREQWIHEAAQCIRNGVDASPYGLTLKQYADTIEQHWEAYLAKLPVAEPCNADVVSRLVSALQRIASHDPNTCAGITESDCLEAVQETARSALAAYRAVAASMQAT